MGFSIRGRLTVVLLVVVAACTGVFFSLDRAGSDEPPHCARNAAASDVRAAAVSGTGTRVVVIGDSYSAGWGLDDPSGSWPAMLSGEVHVDGFSGSGFSAGASACVGVAYADRAPAAVSSVRGGPDLVIVQGGLNDTDQPLADVRSGVRRLLATLQGREVVLVGPPTAPVYERLVGRIDSLLAAEAARAGAAYISMLDVELDYLDDGLHLTADGHRAFGAHVAATLRPPGPSSR